MMHENYVGIFPPRMPANVARMIRATSSHHEIFDFFFSSIVLIVLWHFTQGHSPSI